MSPRLLAVILISLAAAGQAAAAGAEDRTDAARGRALAERWCAECHAVHPSDGRSPNPAAPRFADVAASPVGTQLALHVFLQSEHVAMPAVRLTSQQIDVLAAYIVSLKP